MTLRNHHLLKERLQLYVVTDERADGDALIPIVREAILGGATAIQLRRKDEDGGRFVEIGRALRAVTQELGALFFVNDRVDVAILTGADGVHIGQSDISCRDARRLLGDDKVIGVSASTVQEALKAVEDGADYLGVGAIYATPSKTDADVCGLDGLAEVARHADIPIVAIGGLSLGNVDAAIQSGADGIAVVSYVMSAPNPRAAAADLAKVIGISGKG